MFGFRSDSPTHPSYRHSSVLIRRNRFSRLAESASFVHRCAKSRQKGACTLKAQETLLTAQEVADILRVRPSWVYDHADDLGAFWLGKYLRFSLSRLMERLESGQSLASQPNGLD